MRKAFALPFAILLGGCQLAPPHERPGLPTAGEFPTAYAGDMTPGVRAVEIGWSDFFADPQLEQLVASALERTRDLAIAVARTEAARGQYRIQAADRLPTLGPTGDVARRRPSGRRPEERRVGKRVSVRADPVGR